MERMEKLEVQTRPAIVEMAGHARDRNPRRASWRPRLRSSQPLDQSQRTGLATSGQPGQFFGECWRCGERGHMARNTTPETGVSVPKSTGPDGTQPCSTERAVRQKGAWQPLRGGRSGVAVSTGSTARAVKKTIVPLDRTIPSDTQDFRGDLSNPECMGSTTQDGRPLQSPQAMPTRYSSSTEPTTPKTKFC